MKKKNTTVSREEHEGTNIRIDKAIIDRVKIVAEKENRTIKAQTARLIVQALDNNLL